MTQLLKAFATKPKIDPCKPHGERKTSPRKFSCDLHTYVLSHMCPYIHKCAHGHAHTQTQTHTTTKLNLIKTTNDQFSSIPVVCVCVLWEFCFCPSSNLLHIYPPFSTHLKTNLCCSYNLGGESSTGVLVAYQGLYSWIKECLPTPSLLAANDF